MPDRKYILALVAFWAVIYLGSSGYPPALLDDADTVHAEAAREMAETNDFITLHANGIRYLEKAPMMYWLIALSYKVFGVSEFASRLPIAVSTLALVLAVFFFGRHFFSGKAGFYAGLAVATSIGIFLFTRVLWPDVLLTFFITMAFYCFLRASEGEIVNPRWAYAVYAFGALGVLTKGLIGAAFPAIIIGAYLLLTGEVRRLFQYRLFTGTLLFLLIAAPWHIAAGISNPGDLMAGTPHPSQGRGFFWFYFMNEHFLRYVGKRYPADYDTVPLALFIVLHLVWLFPWSFFLPLAVRNLPRRLRNLDREEKVLLFLAAWAVLIILFFSFSTTQEYYTMPSYPAFALMIGHAIAKAESEWREAKAGKLFSAMQITLAVLGLVVFAVGAIAFANTRGVTVEGDISQTLTRNPEAYALSLGHVLDLTPESLAALRVPVIGTALAFGIGAVAALVFRRGGKHAASNMALAVMMTAFFFFAHSALVAFEPYLSSRALAEAIDREYKEGDVIVINGEYEGGSSINFYTRKMVRILNARSANLEYGSYFKDAPQIFLNDDDLNKMWGGEARVYLFTDGSQVEKVASGLSEPSYTLAESGGKLVLTNRQSNTPWED
ncbi:MAG TPA: glycosyltransferase family 39 protein [Blastocatellia bacterium]|nr:glycosyltransferase family 39 protein [Blastocatellia bacterium]